MLDKQGASANTLSEEVLVELDDVLGELERDPPKGLVMRSAKRGGFIAGADIGEFRGMTDAATIESRLTAAHAMVDRLDQLKVPTVAVIHGYCLGGGLEIALACDYRIAIEDARLRLSRGDARPASRSRRHGAAAAADQSGRGDDPDADRPQRRAPAARRRSASSMR